MAKTIRLLTALFAVQVALAVGLTFTGTSLSAEESGKPLLKFKPDQVNHITIDGPKKEHLVLAKVDGHWQLPELDNFPADKSRVKRLLKQLSDLKSGEPVATTKDARRRFKVAKETFRRRIVLADGDKTFGTLYLGTSPAMRQVHARLDAQNPIYSVNLEIYEVPIKVDEWENHAILQIPRGDIAGIDVDGLQLHRTAEKSAAKPAVAATAKTPAAPKPAKAAWQATHLAAGEHVDNSAVGKLVGYVANLRIESVLGKTAKADYGLDKPALKLTVMRKDGKPVQYEFGKMKSSDYYTVKSSARDEYFKLPSYAAQQVIKAAKRQTLAPGKKVASAKSRHEHRHARYTHHRR